MLIRLLLYARLLDALSRAFSWAWRLWRSAGWCCGLPVRAFRSLFGARVPVLRSGAAGGGAAPGRRAEAASRGLWRPVTGVVCRLSLLLYRTGTRKPGAPRTRIIFNACRRSRDRTIECLQISQITALHATGDKRNTRHETPFHARTVPEPVYVSADSANSRAAHCGLD